MSAISPTKNLGHRKNKEVLQQLISLKSKTVVDVGCGDLTFSKILADLGAQVVAVDPDKVQAQKNSEAELPDNIVFHQAGADAIPLSDDSVDGVFFSYSLHHVPAEIYPRVFAEVQRILRSNGFLYILEPIDCPFNQVMKLFFDEDKEREEAQIAIADIAAPLFENVTSVTYHDFRQYESFDDFVTGFVNKSFNSLYTEDDIRTANVRNAFEQHGAPDYIFQSPKKVVLLSNLLNS